MYQDKRLTVSTVAPGEDCTAGSRVYVQDSVYDKFVNLLIDKVKSTPIGDGFDEAVTSGPIVSAPAVPLRTAIYGDLTRNSNRFPSLNSTRYGATSTPANRKEPKSWSAGKDVRGKATSSIPPVRFPTLKFDDWLLVRSAYSSGQVFADVRQDMKIVSKHGISHLLKKVTYFLLAMRCGR